MATLSALCAQGKLERVTGVPKAGELPVRTMYLVPRAATWMRTHLPTLQSDGFVDGALSPNQQAYQLVRSFVLGNDLFADEWFPKPLRPHGSGHGIWELRTPDLRFFGWFVKRGQFVVSTVATKDALMTHNLYDGYRNQAVADRNDLDLDEPKYLDGEPDDVF
jgi:hypothetical protein